MNLQDVLLQVWLYESLARESIPWEVCFKHIFPGPTPDFRIKAMEEEPKNLDF